jgi:hypothetical protein
MKKQTQTLSPLWLCGKTNYRIGNKMKTKIFSLIAACTILLSALPSFGFQATFTPRISVNEEYTDNLLLSDKNKEHDYITTISPSFTAEILGKNNGASIFYSPSHSFYDRHSENNTWRHKARFSGWAELSKNTRLDVSDSFLRTEDPLTDADIVALRAEDAFVQIDNTIRRSRDTYYTNSAAVNLTHKFGETDSFKLGYVHSILKNEDPGIEDNTRHNPSIGMTYWFIPQWGFDANVSYTKGEYDTSDDLNKWSGRPKLVHKFTRQFEGFVGYGHEVMDYKGETEDYRTYNPFMGFNYAIAEDTSISGDVGYFIHDNKSSDDDSGLTANMSLGKTFKRGSLNLKGSSGHDEANFGAENLGYSKFYEAGGSASYELTRHISGNIFGSFRESKYKALASDRKDQNTRCGLGLTIKPLTWMAIGLNYTYRSVNSTLDENDYEENRGLISITLSPSHPFRKK